MFSGCSGLRTIYASDLFTTGTVTSSSKMFNGCTNLVGGNGTRYSKSNITATYARIDRSGTPGYFTEKTTSRALASSVSTLSDILAEEEEIEAGTTYGLEQTTEGPETEGADAEG